MAKIQIYTTISFWNSQVNIWISVHFLRLCQYLGGCYCFRWDSLWTPPFDCCLLPWELLSSFRKRQTETLAKKVCAASISDVKVLQAPSGGWAELKKGISSLFWFLKTTYGPTNGKSFQNKKPFNLSVNTQNHLYPVPLLPPIWTKIRLTCLEGALHMFCRIIMLCYSYSHCLQTFIQDGWLGKIWWPRSSSLNVGIRVWPIYSNI